MRNDVHQPPLEPEFDPTGKRRGRPTPAVGRGDARPHLHDAADRPHALERASTQSEGIDLVYDEPENRGDSFNTLMSAIIVGVVLTVVLLVIAVMAWS